MSVRHFRREGGTWTAAMRSDTIESKASEMPNTFTAVVKRDGDWWIGWIAEIPGVNCQERTRVALLISLKTALIEALDLNRREALRAAETGFSEEIITV